MAEIPEIKVLHPRLYLGTSSWSAKDWEGGFYPQGLSPGDYLAHYATVFRSVEVDSTWYRIPSEAMTRRWAQVLPEGFRLAAKVPRVITHEKILLECDEELRIFLEAMDHLGDRLGPLLFQFPYFSKKSDMTLDTFVRRLEAFLPSLPDGYRFALEIRNKTWLTPRLIDLLRERSIALALIDHPWMPRIDRLLEDLDPVTTDFTYVRWLGDRKGIEKTTTSWDRIIVDRSAETRRWIPALRKLLERDITVFGYFNNHYAGHAPGSVRLLESLWGE